jgi:hypothetical protein
MLRALLVLFVFARPAKAEDKTVTIAFLGGAKKAPMEGLKATLRGSTGDWASDLKNKVADGKTGKDGAVGFTLKDGSYYVDIDSDKELPYLGLPVGYKGHPAHYGRTIRVEKEQTFEFNLADACKLTLRAVDADTGEGIPGVTFVTENALGEYWALPINGDNVGAKIVEKLTDDSLKTDKDGNFTRFMGPRPGWTYYVWSVPKGYAIPDAYGEVELKTPLGTEKVEHVFKLRKK